MEAKYGCERVDRMYRAMKKDVIRHETVCWEMATKLESQHQVFVQLAENVNALKSASVLTDMHLEAYTPIQTALIAYDVCKGMTHSEAAIKNLNDHFALKVFKSLEKNALKACDLNANSRDSLLWRKLQYKVPENIKKTIEESTEDIGGEDEDTPWINCLRNVNLRNIHLFQERSKGKRPLKNKDSGMSAIESIARLFDSDGSKKSYITGNLNTIDKDLLGIPLQSMFKQLEERGKATLMAPIDMNGIAQYQQDQLSAINECIKLEKVDKSNFLYIQKVNEQQA